MRSCPGKVSGTSRHVSAEIFRLGSKAETNRQIAESCHFSVKQVKKQPPLGGTENCVLPSGGWPYDDSAAKNFFGTSKFEYLNRLEPADMFRLADVVKDDVRGAPCTAESQKDTFGAWPSPTSLSSKKSARRNPVSAATSDEGKERTATLYSRTTPL